MSVDAAPSADLDYNLQVIRPLSLYVAHRYGPGKLGDLAAASGMGHLDLLKSEAWVGLASVERFVQSVADLVGDEQELKRGISAWIGKAYGPLRYVSLAASPGLVLRRAALSLHLLTKNGRWEILSSGRNFLNARYYCVKPESRLLCLLRQWNTAALPTFWGLPPATVTETSCTAAGDGYCELKAQWHEIGRKRVVLGGAVLGAAAAAGLVGAGLAGVHIWPEALLFSALGGLLGRFYELRRAQRINLAYEAERAEAVELLARRAGEAHREILALTARQAQWNRELEFEIASRTGAFEQLLSNLESLHDERERAVRGLSHDAKSPLTVALCSTEMLLKLDPDSPKWGEVLARQGAALRSLDSLLSRLMETVASSAPPPRRAERIAVPPLVEILRRRLSAMVLGRPISVTAFSTREAPESIEADPLFFDRVLDNLMTNAAKYTVRGSIVVEVTGTPGYLTVKISDTGRGIAPEQIEQIFQPAGSRPQERAPNSHGLGLSVVVQLLAEVGGKLEVMSKLGSGTTFWVHFPLASVPAQHPRRAEATAPSEELVAKVVRIRKSKST